MQPPVPMRLTFLCAVDDFHFLFQGSEMEVAEAWVALRDVVPTLATQDVEKHAFALLERGFVGFDEAPESVSVDQPLRLLPNSVVARWIAARLGLDFGVPSADDLAKKCQQVHAAVGVGDALAGSIYEAIPTYGPITLVVVDPPFGLEKGNWDEARHAWDRNEFKSFLIFVSRARAMSKEGYCVAVYTTEGRAPVVEAAFAEVGGDNFKGSLVYIFVSDRATGLFKGQLGLGARQVVVAGKFGKATPMAESNNLMGRFVYFTCPPRVVSKYGRPEIDAVTKSKKGLSVNLTQKSVEDARILIRTLAPKGGVVLSLCNGSATTQVAAALEGRSSVGVDSDPDQVAEGIARLDTLFEREEMLREVLLADRDYGCEQAKALAQALEAAFPVRSLLILPVLFTPTVIKLVGALCALLSLTVISPLCSWSRRKHSAA